MPTNSAYRLHRIFSDAIAGPERHPLSRWASALDVTEDPIVIAPLLFTLMNELNLIEERIEDKFPQHQAAIYLKFFPQIKTSLAQLSNPINLSESALHSLEHLQFLLDDEPEISPGDLNSIAKEIDDLFESVRSSNLKPTLRKWLMSWLSILKQGIDRFKIHGAKGLQDALIRIQGEADVFGTALAQVKEEDPTLYEKFEAFWNKACETTKMLERCQKFYESGKQIAKFGMKLLPVVAIASSNNHEAPLDKPVPQVVIVQSEPAK